MRRTPVLMAAFVACAALLLPACNPTLNWREVQLGSGMRGLLPCKPDQTQQAQSLAGRVLQVQMLGCEAGGALWALASADLGGEAARGYAEVQRAWQAGLERALQSTTPTEVKPYALAAEPGDPGVAAALSGRSSEGRPLKAQALWFQRGSRIHVAMVYAERITPDMLDTFWSNVHSR